MMMIVKATVATFLLLSLPVSSQNPRCDLCKDGSFPGLPWGGATILQPGGQSSETVTCEQLYFRGRAGGITDQMCKVTQYYMAKSCGCREFNPGPSGPNNGWTWQAPGPSPAVNPPRPLPVSLPRPAPKPLPRPAPVPPPRPAPVSQPRPTFNSGWSAWSNRYPKPLIPANTSLRAAQVPLVTPLQATQTSSYGWTASNSRMLNPPNDAEPDLTPMHASPTAGPPPGQHPMSPSQSSDLVHPNRKIKKGGRKKRVGNGSMHAHG